MALQKSGIEAGLKFKEDIMSSMRFAVFVRGGRAEILGHVSKVDGRWEISLIGAPHAQAFEYNEQAAKRMFVNWLMTRKIEPARVMDIINGKLQEVGRGI
jgi:hypothetical protein